MPLTLAQSRSIVRTLTEVMDALDRSWLQLRGKCSEDDFAEYGRQLSAALDSLSCEVLAPIFNEHPGLDPQADEDEENPRQ